MPEAREIEREAKDRLSRGQSYEVGFFYFRVRWYPGRHRSLQGVLQDDPGSRGRDAVYFYLAESLFKTDKKAEALPYYERLVQRIRDRASSLLKRQKRRRGAEGRE